MSIIKVRLSFIIRGFAAPSIKLLDNMPALPHTCDMPLL